MAIELMLEPSGRTVSRFPGFDLAGLLADGAARAEDDGRRRRLAPPPFPAAATPQACVAGWHACCTG